MVYILVWHKIADWDKWKPVFDKDEDERKSYGVHLRKLFRSVNDPNEIFCLFDAPDENAANACINRPHLKDLMQSAGVVSEPVFKILNIS